jgi:hypothetical protein
MRMIGLKDVTLNATDEYGRAKIINFQKGKEVDVPDVFVGTAKAIGYAKNAEDELPPAA